MGSMVYYDCLANENKSIHHGVDTENVNVSKSEGWETVGATQWMKAPALCLQSWESESEKCVTDTDVKETAWM